MTHQDFIEQIVASLKKYAPHYDIKCYSAIIAQFILESGWGTSDKVFKDGEWRHNYAGLKWRYGRCQCTNNYFSEWTYEQNPDGSYNHIESRFFKFSSLDQCVLGYLQWTNTSNYANLKNVTDPKTYLTNIKADKYATSLNYVEKCMAVVAENNLTQYDPVVEKVYFRVFSGTFSKRECAVVQSIKLDNAGFGNLIKPYKNLFRCQVAACASKSSALVVVDNLKAKGFSAFISYC